MRFLFSPRGSGGGGITDLTTTLGATATGFATDQSFSTLHLIVAGGASGASLTVSAPNIPSITTSGGATSLNLGDLSNCTALTLHDSLTAFAATGYSFASFTAPVSCTNLSLTATSALTTMTVGSALTDLLVTATALASVSVNAFTVMQNVIIAAPLGVATTNAFVLGLDANGIELGTLHLTGGAAQPTNDVAATAAHVDVTFLAAITITLGQSGILVPNGGNGVCYYPKVEGGGTPPGMGQDSSIAFDNALLDDADTVAANFAAALVGFTASGSGDTRTITRAVAGLTSPDFAVNGDSLSIANANQGADAYNSHVAALLGKTWSVSIS